jgi:hypothetical protein
MFSTIQITNEVTSIRTFIHEKENSPSIKDAEIQSLKHRLTRVQFQTKSKKDTLNLHFSEFLLISVLIPNCFQVNSDINSLKFQLLARSKQDNGSRKEIEQLQEQLAWKEQELRELRANAEVFISKKQQQQNSLNHCNVSSTNSSGSSISLTTTENNVIQSSNNENNQMPNVSATTSPSVIITHPELENTESLEDEDYPKNNLSENQPLNQETTNVSSSPPQSHCDQSREISTNEDPSFGQTPCNPPNTLSSKSTLTSEQSSHRYFSYLRCVGVTFSLSLTCH